MKWRMPRAVLAGSRIRFLGWALTSARLPRAIAFLAQVAVIAAGRAGWGRSKPFNPTNWRGMTAAGGWASTSFATGLLLIASTLHAWRLIPRFRRWARLRWWDRHRLTRHRIPRIG